MTRCGSLVAARLNDHTRGSMAVCPGCRGKKKKLRYSINDVILKPVDAQRERVRICRCCWIFTRRHFGFCHQPHLRCAGMGKSSADPADCAEKLALFQLPAGATFRDALTDEVVQRERARVLGNADQWGVRPASSVGKGRVGRPGSKPAVSKEPAVPKETSPRRQSTGRADRAARRESRAGVAAGRACVGAEPARAAKRGHPSASGVLPRSQHLQLASKRARASATAPLPRSQRRKRASKRGRPSATDAPPRPKRAHPTTCDTVAQPKRTRCTARATLAQVTTKPADLTTSGAVAQGTPPPLVFQRSTTSGLVKPAPRADTKLEQTGVKRDPTAWTNVCSAKVDPGRIALSIARLPGKEAGCAVDVKAGATGPGKPDSSLHPEYDVGSTDSSDTDCDNPLETPASEWRDRGEPTTGCSTSPKPSHAYCQALVLMLDAGPCARPGTADELFGSFDTSELDKLFAASSARHPCSRKRPLVSALVVGPPALTGHTSDALNAAIDDCDSTFPRALGDLPPAFATNLLDVPADGLACDDVFM